MKRFKEYNPDQNYLISLNPRETFPSGCFENFIISILDQIVNEEDFYPKKEDRGGAEAHNPKAILGIMFYAYSRGIYSYRKMARSCLYDINFIYISGYTTPDYSTISRFAQKFEEQITNLFSMILYTAAEQGYIDYEMTATDGTKLIANASERFSGTIEDFKKRRTKLEEKIKTALARSEEASEEETQNYWNKKEENYKQEKNKIDEFLKNAKEIKKKDGKEIKQNITDKNARTMKIEGRLYKPGFNAQATVCAKEGIIVGATVTDQANDVQQLKPMMELIKKLAPDELQDKIKESRHLADNGYYSVDNIVYSDTHNLDVYIPPSTTKELYAEKEIESKDKSIGIKHCTIDKSGPTAKIICPGGQVLTQFTEKTGRGVIYCDFRVHDSDFCKNCSSFSKCCGHLKDKSYKSFRLRKDLLENWEVIQQNKDKIKSEEGKKIYSKRMGAIEKVFGHIKGNLGYKRVLVRGIKKVKSFWSVICMTYNLVRLYNLKYEDRKIVPKKPIKIPKYPI